MGVRVGQVGVTHTLILLAMAYLPAQRYPIPRARAIMMPTCTALMMRATAPYFSALVRPYSSAAEFHARSKNPMRTMMRYAFLGYRLLGRSRLDQTLDSDGVPSIKLGKNEGQYL